MTTPIKPALHSASRRLAAVILATQLTLASAASQISGADAGPAIGGYDPVAYFVDGRPARGKPEFEAEWHGASWRFASAAHRELFLKKPEKYAPQYGGYCAYAAARGSVATGNGAQWKIVDDKLYLNNNFFAQKLWQLDPQGNIVDSERKWPEVRTRIEARR